MELTTECILGHQVSVCQEDVDIVIGRSELEVALHSSRVDFSPTYQWSRLTLVIAGPEVLDLRFHLTATHQNFKSNLKHMLKTQLLWVGDSGHVCQMFLI